ncbi:MAG: hypothetical protein KGI00_01215 [Candidatus Micrarchaeota archaeon]|nr:hypothetical protein [Candidatus Micrarchaeota archaeon]MDE1823914.1 hypothetical protein [Candidatus Micrarchaeota archaeon]MDE1849328.1 hypothetical protein [Candidatus Micrarchaeota archaeon]
MEQAILKPDKVVASRGDRYKATGNTDVGRISVLYTEKEGKVTVLTAYPGE